MQISIQEKIFDVVVSNKKFLKEKVIITNSTINVFLSEENNKSAKTIFEKWIREYAKKIITKRVNELAKEHSFKFNRISIREQSTRWGSCSSEKNLNFNWKLILAPAIILDYVIIHELAHTVEMNHSRAFWNVVASAMPDYNQHRSWLRTNGGSLTIK